MPEPRRADARHPPRMRWPAVAASMLLGASLGVAAAPAGTDGVAAAPTVADGDAAAATRRLYEVTTETGMPHLDENLRYATTRERRCVAPRELAQGFPMLAERPLQDCRLEPDDDRPAAPSWTLRCTGGHGTTGHARWQWEPEQFAGTLDVRLGGKNTTFWQRISGRAVGGACS